VIPRRHVPPRHALIGALCAAVLFESMKLLFVAYVGSVANYSLVYGAFASVPIFLLWLFFCWVVVLVGAEVAATLSYIPSLLHEHAPHATRSGDARELRATVLGELSSSENSLSVDQLRRRLGAPIDHIEDVVDQLLVDGVIEAETSRYAVFNPATSRRLKLKIIEA
jgi:membrane protein